MEIIHNPSLEEPFIVAYKAQGLPTAPIKEGDNCAFTQIAEIFPECKSVQGKKAIEGGLLHRLDTDTQGLILIATNQDFYDYMLEGQEEGRFLKKYIATCNRDLLITEKLKGFPPLPKDIQMNLNKSNRFVLTSSFRAFGKGRKEVRPVTEECGHYQSKKASKNTYETIIELNKNKDTSFSAYCTITKGFRHQVRCHLAWLGFPIIGDKIYNSGCYEKEKLQFFATGLTFTWNNKDYTFSGHP
mgnify:CR=1 FL=1